jgi:hypothetical protein
LSGIFNRLGYIDSESGYIDKGSGDSPDKLKFCEQHNNSVVGMDTLKTVTDFTDAIHPPSTFVGSRSGSSNSRTKCRDELPSLLTENFHQFQTNEPEFLISYGITCNP